MKRSRVSEYLDARAHKTVHFWLYCFSHFFSFLSIAGSKTERRGRRVKPALLLRAATAGGAKRRGLTRLPRSVQSQRERIGEVVPGLKSTRAIWSTKNETQLRGW